MRILVRISLAAPAQLVRLEALEGRLLASDLAPAAHERRELPDKDAVNSAGLA